MANSTAGIIKIFDKPHPVLIEGGEILATFTDKESVERFENLIKSAKSRKDEKSKYRRNSGEEILLRHVRETDR